MCHETRGFRGLTVFRTSPHAASPPNPMKVVRQVHGKVKVDHMIYLKKKFKKTGFENMLSLNEAGFMVPSSGREGRWKGHKRKRKRIHDVIRP